MSRRLLRVWSLGFCVALSPNSKLQTPSAVLQANAVVDEGTYMLSRNGVPVGRESFRIIRAAGAGGQAFRAVGTAAIGELKLSSVLTTDSAWAPLSYELRMTERGEQTQVVQGRGRGDRFSVLVQTKSGEAAREYLVGKGTVLMDDDLFHPLHLVALAALSSPDSSVTVIAPRGASQSRLTLRLTGPEKVAIAGRTLETSHFVLSGDSGVRAELWLDARHRPLKATLPERGLTALRDDPPR